MNFKSQVAKKQLAACKRAFQLKEWINFEKIKFSWWVNNILFNLQCGWFRSWHGDTEIHCTKKQLNMLRLGRNTHLPSTALTLSCDNFSVLFKALCCLKWKIYLSVYLLPSIFWQELKTNGNISFTCLLTLKWQFSINTHHRATFTRH